MKMEWLVKFNYKCQFEILAQIGTNCSSLLKNMKLYKLDKLLIIKYLFYYYLMKMMLVGLKRSRNKVVVGEPAAEYVIRKIF